MQFRRSKDVAPVAGSRGPQTLPLVALLAVLLSASGWAGKPQIREYEVKSAFIHSFTKYVQHPEDARGGSSAVVGVLGVDPFGPYLEKTFAGKKVDGVPYQVKRVATIAEARGCRVLFIASSEDKRLAEIIAGLQGSPTLLVGDTPGFARRGVMINMFIENDKVRFEINAAAARAARLEISSKLLSLAREPK